MAENDKRGEVVDLATTSEWATLTVTGEAVAVVVVDRVAFLPKSPAAVMRRRVKGGDPGASSESLSSASEPEFFVRARAAAFLRSRQALRSSLNSIVSRR